MLLVEENHVGATRSTPTDNQMLYVEVDQPYGRGWRGGSACINGGQNYQKTLLNMKMIVDTQKT